jgi:dCTP deaminase
VILSDIDLRAEIDAGRLVFDPAIPPDSSKIQSASIDLSLKNVFWKAKIPVGAGIEIIVDVGDALAYDYLEEIEADEIMLGPGEFLLGETAEGISVPQHLCGWIEGKSGRARHGLIVHCTAPHIAPGWGTPRPKSITLELANLGTVPLRLRAGIGIAQLIVMRLGSPSIVQYAGKHVALGSSS